MEEADAEIPADAWAVPALFERSFEIPLFTKLVVD